MAPRGKSSKRKRKDSEDEFEKDSDIDRGVGSSSKKGGKRRDRHDLNILLAQDEAEASHQNLNCWTSVRSGPPSTPPRAFCCVCGFMASYRCAECYKHKPTSFVRYFCSPHCRSVHAEVDCCKARNVTVW